MSPKLRLHCHHEAGHFLYLVMMGMGSRIAKVVLFEDRARVDPNMMPQVAEEYPRFALSLAAGPAAHRRWVRQNGRIPGDWGDGGTKDRRLYHEEGRVVGYIPLPEDEGDQECLNRWSRDRQKEWEALLEDAEEIYAKAPIKEAFDSVVHAFLDAAPGVIEGDELVSLVEAASERLADTEEKWAGKISSGNVVGMGRYDIG